MFNRSFFEGPFIDSLKEMAEKEGSPSPAAEFTLFTGQSFYVTKVLNTSDRWIEVEFITEEKEKARTFLPYRNIARVSIFEEAPQRKGLGFIHST